MHFKRYTAIVAFAMAGLVLPNVVHAQDPYANAPAYGKPVAGSDENGGWEFSGVVDAEAVLGRGSWLLNVQAHSLRIAPTNETVEGGQILHMVWKPLDEQN
jgi:hypothetical protein